MTTNTDLALALQVLLTRAGWHLELHAIVAVLETQDEYTQHSVRDAGKELQDAADLFAVESVRFERELNQLHRKLEEKEREIASLIGRNARLTRDLALSTQRSEGAP